jgi:hypothetical protein
LPPLLMAFLFKIKRAFSPWGLASGYTWAIVRPGFNVRDSISCIAVWAKEMVPSKLTLVNDIRPLGPLLTKPYILPIRIYIYMYFFFKKKKELWYAFYLTVYLNIKNAISTDEFCP